MDYYQLLSCLESTKLSPEGIAPYIGVSNMTLRRWAAKSNQPVESQYLAGIISGLYKMISDGHLSLESKQVQNLIKHDSPTYFEAIRKTLGIDVGFLSGDSSEESMFQCLRTIGSSERKQNEVDSKHNEIKSYERLGKEWKKRISSLLEITSSKELVLVDKLVAYGALFYLLMPFDLIPDYIPVFGLIDDFAILGFAALYYSKRYSKMIKKNAL